MTSSSSAADPMSASSTGNPDDRSTAEPPLLGPVVRGVTPVSGAPEARPGSFAPPFAATAPRPAPVAPAAAAPPAAEPEPVVDLPVEEEPVALAGAEEAWDDEELEEALATDVEGDAAGPELEFLDGAAWEPDVRADEEPAGEVGEEIEPAPGLQPSAADHVAAWEDTPAAEGETAVEAAAVEDEPGAPLPEPLPAEVELPAAALLEEPASGAAEDLAAWDAPEPEPAGLGTGAAASVSETEAGLAEVAGRLERLAAALRQGAPPPIPAADGSADPLEVLITGYALGYAEALRRRPPPPAG